MVAPKFKQKTLWVKATDDSNVREIDEQGRPLVALRNVGKNGDDIIEEGVQLPYHPHYIAELKRGSLLPMDSQTARYAGVNFSQGN